MENKEKKINLTKEEADKMQFQFVTGTCKNCGGNKFKFDPKEQTFVCEYCQTEVYAAKPLPEQEEPDDENGNDEDTNYSVEPLEEEKSVSYSSSSSSSSYSGSYHSYSGGSLLSAMPSILTGMFMVGLPTFLRQTNFLEELSSNAESAAEGADTITPMLTQVMGMMLHILPLLGCMMIITGMFKLVKYFMRGY